MTILFYLFPASSPETKAPSTIVNEPTPGKTRDFNISVPVVVALIKHTLALSNAVCPWSPQSLSINYKPSNSIYIKFDRKYTVIGDHIFCFYPRFGQVTLVTERPCYKRARRTEILKMKNRK